MATELIARPAQQVNTQTAGDQTGAVVAPLASGGHVVAWNSNGNVLAQVFDAGGNRSGGELTLFTGQSLGGIAALADGSLVVSASRSWGDSSGPHSELSYLRMTTGGTVLAGPTVIDNTGNFDIWVTAGAVYAMPGGGFGITDVHTTRPVPWQSVDASIRFFDAGNAPTGAAAPGDQGFLFATEQMKSGGFITGGNTNFGPTPISSYMWRTVDASGHLIASASFTSQYGVDDYYASDVVALTDGRALAVWEHMTYGYKGVGNPVLQAQWIDPSGHPTGGIFVLGAEAYGPVKLAALAGGAFLATWTQQASYGAPVELYAQHFDANAQKDSGVVHLATLGTGIAPGDTGYDITATPDGGFLLDFQRNGDGQDIWEQEFDIAGAGGGTPTGHIDVNGGITPIGNGNFTVTGSAGLDQVSLAYAHTQWSVLVSASTATLSGPGGVDVLTGVERVRFNDGYAVALDVNGVAAQAYRLYQATFDRAPDTGGLGYWIQDLDAGDSLRHVAQYFVQSPEFQSRYGTQVSDVDFVTLLYANVLHRTPDAGGLAFHLNELAQGDTRANTLIDFSESAENQANVIGQISHGMLYLPYG